MLRLARVATDFSFIQWRKGWKEQEIPLRLFSWVRGVDYEKGRYQHPFHPWFSMVWYDGRTNLRFCVCVRKCFGLARVATEFLFYPKERSKSTWKTFEIVFGFGGRLLKGKVLAPFSSMVFYGLLVTCFRSFAFAFQLFEMVLLCVVLKVFWKEAFV